LQFRFRRGRDLPARGGKCDLAGAFFNAGLQDGFEMFDLYFGLVRAGEVFCACLAGGFDDRRVKFWVGHDYSCGL